MKTAIIGTWQEFCITEFHDIFFYILRGFVTGSQKDSDVMFLFKKIKTPTPTKSQICREERNITKEPLEIHILCLGANFTFTLTAWREAPTQTGMWTSTKAIMSLSIIGTSGEGFWLKIKAVIPRTSSFV